MCQGLCRLFGGSVLVFLLFLGLGVAFLLLLFACLVLVILLLLIFALFLFLGVLLPVLLVLLLLLILFLVLLLLGTFLASFLSLVFAFFFLGSSGELLLDDLLEELRTAAGAGLLDSSDAALEASLPSPDPEPVSAASELSFAMEEVSDAFFSTLARSSCTRAAKSLASSLGLRSYAFTSSDCLPWTFATHSFLLDTRAMSFSKVMAKRYKAAASEARRAKLRRKIPSSSWRYSTKPLIVFLMAFFRG